MSPAADRMAIVTPSHAPDAASFARLHASVLRWTDPGVRHLVVVPPADVPLFRGLGGDRLEVLGYPEVLPREFVSTTRLARLPGLPRGYRIAAINARRPWPPIRGWILQQVVKLAVVAALDVDVALLIDSDVLVVRPLTASTFLSDGAVRLYRLPYGIDDAMPRHRRWQQTSARLLGLAAPEADSPDYIAPFSTWSPAVVRDALDRVGTTTGAPWARTAASSLDFSEFILIGTYASAVDPSPGRVAPADRSLCHSHWDPRPLDLAAARSFLDSLAADELAVHIQSNSETPESVLAWVAERFADDAA